MKLVIKEDSKGMIKEVKEKFGVEFNKMKREWEDGETEDGLQMIEEARMQMVGAVEETLETLRSQFRWMNNQHSMIT